ncbi:MAG: WecB/TagA/CpsF family glycosyltransferase [Microgenomates group bacterium]
MLKNKQSTTISSRKVGNILGISVLSTSKEQVLTWVKDFISHNKQFYIVTPNPELVLMAQKDNELKIAMNSADISTPDGIGLAQAHKFLSLKAPKNLLLRFIVTLFQGIGVGISTFVNKNWLTRDLHILKGRELFNELIVFADKSGLKVFLLGGKGNEAQRAKEKLEKTYKKVRIESLAGPILNNKAEPVTEVDRKIHFDAINKINNFKPDFLFVAMQNPKQEKWIYKNINSLDIKGAMAVGGTFNYVSGVSKLPPKLMENLGLEWVWRLVTEPSRLGRILNAWPIFPIKVWYTKLVG